MTSTEDRTVEPNDKVAQLAELMATMRCVDLAPRLERGMPRFPSHPHTVIDPTVTHAHDGYYCQSISMAEHTGAHVDAPAHIHADRMEETIEKIDPARLVGPAVLYDFSARDWQPGETLTAEDFLRYEGERGVAVGAGDMALVNFGWLRRYWQCDHRAHFYARNQPGMDAGAAELLADRGVRAVGADTLACETPIVNGVEGDAPGHKRFWLPRGILIVEALARLELLPLRSFLFMAPLPIANGSGSPLRPLAFF